jgi:HAMP domain-containing protein
MSIEQTTTKTLDYQQLLRTLQALRDGDLSQRMPEGQAGVAGEIAATLNATFEKLNSVTSEINRIAREVGAEGKLGGQAHVPGVSGAWKDVTDNVNSMAYNLTGQFRNIAEATWATAKGEVPTKVTVDARGEILELKQMINTMGDQLQNFAAEVTRIVREVGTEGRFGGQAEVRGVAGIWKDLVDNVNLMGVNLTNQIRNMVQVTHALAHGDSSRTVTVNAQGETQELKNNINALVDRQSGRP